MTARLLTRLAATLRRNQAPAGRHRAPRNAPDDWSPLDPRWRERMAPNYYAERPVHAGPDDDTGIYDFSEVNQ